MSTAARANLWGSFGANQAWSFCKDVARAHRLRLNNGFLAPHLNLDSDPCDHETTRAPIQAITLQHCIVNHALYRVKTMGLGSFALHVQPLHS